MEETIQIFLALSVIFSLAIAICFFVLCSNVAKIKRRVCGVTLTNKDFEYWKTVLADKDISTLSLISKGLAGYVSYNNLKYPVNEECIQIARLMLEDKLKIKN